MAITVITHPQDEIQTLSACILTFRHRNINYNDQKAVFVKAGACTVFYVVNVGIKKYVQKSQQQQLFWWTTLEQTVPVVPDLNVAFFRLQGSSIMLHFGDL